MTWILVQVVLNDLHVAVRRADWTNFEEIDAPLHQCDL